MATLGFILVFTACLLAVLPSNSVINSVLLILGLIFIYRG